MRGKLAIITDVHGNAPALRAALAAIDRRGDVGHIYCLGDMVSIGPDTNEVLDILFARADLSMITGNHEDYVLALATGRDPGVHGEELAHQRWIAARLDRRFVPLLQALPRTRTVTAGRWHLHLTHYHLEDSHFAAIEWQPALESLEARYEGSPADAILFGHHHPVHHFRSQRRLYLNPGSLGCCDRPVARYAILDPAGDAIGVELQEAAYDNREFLASYDRLQVPARDFILKIFHGNQHAQIPG